MKQNMCCRVATSKYICEFGRSAGYRFMRIWKREFKDIDENHILNFPDYSRLLVDLTSHDCSKPEMIATALKYGFNPEQFKINKQ